MSGRGPVKGRAARVDGHGMGPRRPLGLLLLASALGAALPAAAQLHVWVDERGVTHVTDDPERLPPGSRGAPAGDPEQLATLWHDGIAGPPVGTPPGASGTEEDRSVRALRAAVDDLRRGETARAAAALREVLRRDPGRAEAHWYLALLSGRRGRLDEAEAHLRRFLGAPDPALAPWRASARRRLERIEDERRLMESPAAGALRLVDLAHPAFRIQADAALVASGDADFAGTVARYLEDARSAVGALLGAVPAEPTGVVLYGRAAYLRTHGARFSFRTVGFFDGRIHVVSAAHPAGELRALLFHEYAHAVFRERAGGDRPFWLNEGFAELAERGAEGRDPVTRSERTQLIRAIEAGRWIPLERLAPSFAGLDDGEARLAYLEATAAAAWLVERSDAATRGALLDKLGAGHSADEALRGLLGLSTRGVDEALQREIRSRF